MKKIVQALQAGFSDSRRYWRVLIPFYTITLLLAGLTALPWRALIYAEAGQSLILTDLVKGFNYTFLNDFLQNYGAALGPLLNLSLLALIPYLLAMVFLVAGLIALIVKAPATYERAVFWGGGGEYFSRILRLTLLFLLVHGLVLFLFIWLYLTVIQGASPAKLDNEGIITASLNWIIPLYVLVAAFVFMWQDYAKVFLIRQKERWIWRPIGQSIRFVVQNFKDCYITYLLNMLLLALVFLVNHLITAAFEIDSAYTIFASFLISQVFLLARYVLKVVNLGSVVSLDSSPDD
ncbi:MAG: hypothetical protein AAGJ93_11385 [Bacteroidota bacterium]